MLCFKALPHCPETGIWEITSGDAASIRQTALAPPLGRKTSKPLRWLSPTKCQVGRQLVNFLFSPVLKIAREKSVVPYRTVLRMQIAGMAIIAMGGALSIGRFAVSR